jgi:hypothetical protein
MRRRRDDPLASWMEWELGELEASIEAGRTEAEHDTEARLFRLTPEPEREPSHPGALLADLFDEAVR